MSQPDLRDLYQEVILDHGRRPRNFRAIAGADRTVEGYNPLCGDQVTLYLKLADGVVQDASFQGKGCAISTASASMLTEAVAGKTREEVERLFESFRALITGLPGAPPDPQALQTLGKLAVFSGVCEFPNRVKCASLVWHTLDSALSGRDETVSTE